MSIQLKPEAILFATDARLVDEGFENEYIWNQRQRRPAMSPESTFIKIIRATSGKSILETIEKSRGRSAALK